MPDNTSDILELAQKLRDIGVVKFQKGDLMLEFGASYVPVSFDQPSLNERVEEYNQAVSQPITDEHDKFWSVE